MLKINLKEVLKEKGMSLSDLSRATGISLNAISAFANAKSTAVQFGTLEKILKVLEVDASELFQVIKSLASLRIESLPSNNSIWKNSYSFKVIAYYFDTEEIEEVLLDVVINSTFNVTRIFHSISYLAIHEDVEVNYLALNINNNNSSILKAIDFLIVHHLIENDLLEKNDQRDLFVFDYSDLIKNAEYGSFRTSVTGADSNYKLLELIEYIADPGIDEIIFNEDNTFQSIHVYL
ncbi:MULTISPECIES: helix-turn-helix domain-containing protein [Lysinibacillus]|uniref:helix-turn-helix domain-containing protein n=1 Tax=Lysinibacillus TaxID=400634 RepID=UPI0004DA2135|nr:MULTISPECIES: helix-turn-helix transcriptional regulator [Lysinibacillus]AJK85911.1 hypothetical protein HR49_01065 [Lysinibacillus fusiformis]KHK50469.1 hypothetical protein PI85_17490 [Lysinibacillus sp. A1]